MRTGVRLAIDPGSVRVGVARSDPAGILAVPVVTLRRGQDDIAEIARLVVEFGVIEVLVGNPIGLSGQAGRAAAQALDYAEQIAAVAAVAAVEVRLVDERFSTTRAQRQLAELGRKKNQVRSVIDQAAAVDILQHALDFERSTGSPAGTTVRKV